MTEDRGLKLVLAGFVQSMKEGESKLARKKLHANGRGVAVAARARVAAQPTQDSSSYPSPDGIVRAKDERLPYRYLN